MSKDQSQFAAVRSGLQEQLERIEAALKGYGVPLDEPEADRMRIGRDLADIAIGFDFVAKCLRQHRLNTLCEKQKAITQALKLLAAGTYGICTMCGQHIPFDRLEATDFLATRCGPCSGCRRIP